MYEDYVEPSYKVFMRANDKCFLWVVNCKVFLGYSIFDFKFNWVNIVKGCELLEFWLGGFFFFLGIGDALSPSNKILLYQNFL